MSAIFPAINNQSIDWYARRGDQWAITQPPKGLIKPSVAQFYLVHVSDEQAVTREEFYGYGDDKFVGLRFSTDGAIKFMVGDGLTEKVRRAIQAKAWCKLTNEILPDAENTQVTDIVYLSVKCSVCGKFKRPIDCMNNEQTQWSGICKECSSK